MKNLIAIIIIFFFFFMPENLMACATCFGDPDALATKGINKAITAMLGVTGGVLGGFGSLIYILRQRAKKYAQKMNSRIIKDKRL